MIAKQIQRKKKRSKIETWVTRNCDSKVIAVFPPDMLHLCTQANKFSECDRLSWGNVQFWIIFSQNVWRKKAENSSSKIRLDKIRQHGSPTLCHVYGHFRKRRELQQTRSRAQAKPPWIWTNLSWPWGGSPRRASTFWMPLALIVSRAWSIFSTGMLVQVRCIIVSTQTMFCILLAISRVRSAVEPPAPQVMSQKAGPCATIRSMRSKRLSTPSSVLGGKNSKEKTTLPSSAPAARIFSITFIAQSSPLLQLRGERRREGYRQWWEGGWGYESRSCLTGIYVREGEEWEFDFGGLSLSNIYGEALPLPYTKWWYDGPLLLGVVGCHYPLPSPKDFLRFLYTDALFFNHPSQLFQKPFEFYCFTKFIIKVWFHLSKSKKLTIYSFCRRVLIYNNYIQIIKILTMKVHLEF